MTWLLLVLVLALGVGVGFLANEAVAMRDQLEGVKARLDQERSAASSRAAAVDAAFSPLALDHAKTAKALLDKGDKASARQELKRAQRVAVSVRDLGSGNPPGELVAALTGVEKAFGQPPTLTPPMMGGT